MEPEKCTLCGDLEDYECADYSALAVPPKPLSPAAEKFFEAHQVNYRRCTYDWTIVCKECGQAYRLDIDTEQFDWVIDLRRLPRPPLAEPGRSDE